MSMSSPFHVPQLWTLYIQLPKTSCCRQLSPGQPKKSAVVVEIMDAVHDIKFNSICRLDRAASYMDHMLKEATEIRLHPNNFFKDSDLM